MGAGHADHIDLARGDGITGSGDILDLGAMEGGKIDLATYFSSEIQVRGAGHALDGNHVGEPRVCVDVAANHVEEVDQAAVLQAP